MLDNADIIEWQDKDFIKSVINDSPDQDFAIDVIYLTMKHREGVGIARALSNAYRYVEHQRNLKQ